MPYLQLTQASLADRSTLFRLEALMLSPDDESLRTVYEEFSHAQEAVRLLRSGSSLNMSSEELASVIQLSLDLPRRQYIDADARKRFQYGIIAGGMLNRLLGADETIGGAREALGDRHRRQRIGPSTIRDSVWPKWRPVAAFWAARLALFGAGRDDGAFPCRLEDLPRLLATAEWIRERGEAHRLKNSTEYALPPGETWRIPESLVLPAVEVTFAARVG